MANLLALAASAAIVVLLVVLAMAPGLVGM